MEKVVSRLRMQNSMPVSMPLAAHFKLLGKISPSTEGLREYMSHVCYASAIRSLMYAVVCTSPESPDIAQVVGIVSWYMCNMGKQHWQVVKWILRYLCGSMYIGHIFQRERKMQVCGYADSDYIGDLNKMQVRLGTFLLCAGNLSVGGLCNMLW